MRKGHEFDACEIACCAKDDVGARFFDHSYFPDLYILSTVILLALSVILDSQILSFVRHDSANCERCQSFLSEKRISSSVSSIREMCA